MNDNKCIMLVCFQNLITYNYSYTFHMSVQFDSGETTHSWLAISSCIGFQQFLTLKFLGGQGFCIQPERQVLALYDMHIQPDYLPQYTINVWLNPL